MLNSIKEIMLSVLAGIIVALFTKWLNGKDN